MNAERQPSQTKESLCQECPRRSYLGKILAKLANLPQTAADCDGPVMISRTDVSYVEWDNQSDERQPNLRGKSYINSSHRPYEDESFPIDASEQEKADWRKRQQARIETYTIMNRSATIQCGQDAVVLHEGERPLFGDEVAFENLPGNRRRVDILSGDERGFEDVRFAEAMRSLEA